MSFCRLYFIETGRANDVDQFLETLADADEDEFFKKVEKNAYIIDASRKIDDVNDAIDEMKIVMAGTGKKLVADFQEPIKKLVKTLLDLSKKVSDFVSKLSGKQKQAILGVIAVADTIKEEEIEQRNFNEGRRNSGFKSLNFLFPIFIFFVGFFFKSFLLCF